MDPKKVKWEVKNFFQKIFLVEDLDRSKKQYGNVAAPKAPI